MILIILTQLSTKNYNIIKYHIMPVDKKNVFKWNHISKNLTSDEITKLQNLYKHYHKLFKCYQWKYKKLRRLKLSLQLSSISLTVVGTITGSITLNPVVAGTVVGAGVIIQGYLAKTNLLQRIAKCRLAYTSYEKIMVQLRHFLRGIPYYENVFLSDIKLIDDMIIDQCPSADEYSKKYNKKFIEE